MWLWCRSAATALILPLAWEPPYATGMALKSKERKKERKKRKEFPSCAVEMNWARNHEVASSIPGLAQWVKHLALLWLWRSPAAVARIRPLAWEPPYAASVALKRHKNKKQ